MQNCKEITQYDQESAAHATSTCPISPTPRRSSTHPKEYSSITNFTFSNKNSCFSILTSTWSSCNPFTLLPANPIQISHKSCSFLTTMIGFVCTWILAISRYRYKLPPDSPSFLLLYVIFFLKPSEIQQIYETCPLNLDCFYADTHSFPSIRLPSTQIYKFPLYCVNCALNFRCCSEFSKTV